MKLTTTYKSLAIAMSLLFLWSVFPLPIRADANDIDWSLTQTRPLTEVLEELGETYQVLFSYNMDLLSDVNVNFSYTRGEALSHVMDRLLDETNFTYETYGNKYFVVFEKTKEGIRDAKKLKRNVKRINQLENKGNLVVSPQNISKVSKVKMTADFLLTQKLEKTVSGNVTTSTGEPVIGATVIGAGSTAGVLTDQKGDFSITVPDNVTTLIISYVGYATQSVNIDGQTMLNIVLTE